MVVMQNVSEQNILNVHNTRLCVAACYNECHAQLAAQIDSEKPVLFIYYGNTQMSVSPRQCENKSIVFRAKL